MKLLKFTLNRDFILRTLDGPSFRFVKGEVTNVPVRYAEAVIAIGGEAVGEDAGAGAEAKARMERERAADVDRIEKIEKAVRLLVDRNLSGDFTAGGKPNKKKVAVIVGDDVSEQEIAVAFEKIKQDA